MQRILVTGAFGFVGPHLVHELQTNGYEVIRHHTNVTAKPDVVFDLLDRDAVRDGIRSVRPDGIIHLAAQSSVRTSWDNPSSTLDVNIVGTSYLLEAIRDLDPDCRLVTVGSAEEYGIPRSASPLSEGSPCNPINPYALSKLSVALLVSQFSAAYGLHIIHARPFNHIGPGQRPGFVLVDFARQLVEIQKGKQRSVIRVGNLDAVRDFTDVRDVVRAYRLLLETGDRGSIYNVASGYGISIREVLDRMISLLGLDVTVEVDQERLRPLEVPVLIGNAARLRDTLGWIPEIHLNQTLSDVLKENGAVVK